MTIVKILIGIFILFCVLVGVGSIVNGDEDEAGEGFCMLALGIVVLLLVVFNLELF